MHDARAWLPHFAPLLRYPGPDCALHAGRAAIALADFPAVAERLSRHAQWLAGLTRHEAEEAFTRTFDINPAVALEVGFHLFGLAYQRGQFLARVQQALTEHGLSCGSELPDHLTVLLELAPALPQATGVELIEEAIHPAVAHMRGGFDPNQPGFGQPVLALHDFLAAHFKCVIYQMDEEATREGATSHV